jgi:predicted GNAT family N-acyltransferase
MAINIKSPENEVEWNGYFELRWLVLRSPWKQPKGTEKDNIEFEKNTFHAMAYSQNNEIVGVARLNLLPNNDAQVRFMAVANNQQGKGVGSKLLEYLEKIAKAKGAKTIILQAREPAIDFYKKHHYQIEEKTFLLYNQIQHFLMVKII